MNTFVSDPRIEEAINLVMTAFKGKVRIGPFLVPASTHSISVGLILLKAGCTIETVLGGFCHDMDEDTDVKLLEIGHKFGPRVRKIVSVCTIDTELEKVYEVKAEMLLFEKVVMHTKNGDLEPLKVKCADSLDNLRTNRDLPMNWQIEALERGIRWLVAGKEYLGNFIVLEDFELVVNHEKRRLQFS